MPAGVRRGLGAALAGLLLSAGLLASPAALADGDECGTAPTDGGTVTCDETTYTYQPGSGNSPGTNDDLGIEYSFSGGSSTNPHNYTINIEDDPDTTGSIDVDTTADGDYGLHGAHSGIGDLTIGMSAGDITTTGLNAAGLFGKHTGSGNLAITLSGGSITTNNTTTGATAKHEGSGVWARHEGATGTVSVTMSGGRIVTKQEKASGILAQRGASSSCEIDANGVGNCDITVTMSGGHIHPELYVGSDGAHGIFAHGYNTGTTPNITNYVGNIDIDMTGGKIDARGTSGTGAHGIYGKHEGTTGTLDILVSGNSEIYSDHAEAIRLEAAFAKTLTLNSATIWRWTQGNVISFGGLDGADATTNDTLTVAGNTRIEGVVDFGGGTDKFILNTCQQSDVEDSNDTDCHNGTAYGDLKFDHDFRSDENPSSFNNLEQIDKIGSGLARLTTGMDADGATMSLKDGKLHLDGHLDLGDAGTLTIHNQTQLIFGVRNATDYGHITADKVKFDNGSWERLYLAGGVTLPANSNVDLLQGGSGAGKFYKADGTTEVAPGLYDLNDMLLTTVESDGDVTAAISTDDPECGPIPTEAPFTITCSETTYDLGTRGEDPGIEYDFGNSANDYTVHFAPGALQVLPTAAGDHGFHGHHEGAGDLTVSMTNFTGEVEATGSNTHGFYAHHEGSGDLAVRMNSGYFFRFSAEGSGGHGLYAHHTGTGDITIDLESNNLSEVHAIVDNGHSLYAHHEGSGSIDVTIATEWVFSQYAAAIHLKSGSAKTLTLRSPWVQRYYGGDAIVFGGDTNDQMTVADRTVIDGDVRLGGGDDVLMIAGAASSRIAIDDVYFGAGTDRLDLATCMQADFDDIEDIDCWDYPVTGDLELVETSTFSDLEHIFKVGSGLARLPGLNANGATMVLGDGKLRLDGHLDLGAAGTLTIHDGTRLIFGFRSVTDTNYGHITADKVKFDDDGWQKLYLAGGVTLPANSGVDLLRATGSGAGTFYNGAGSTTVTPGLYDLNDMRLADVGSDGVVAAAVSTDDPECGPIPTDTPFTITCSETTYTTGTRGDDAGIEYDFGNSANDYTIRFMDDPDNTDVSFQVRTHDEGDHGIQAAHAGSGDLTVNMTSGTIHPPGSNAHGILGQHTGSGNLAINMSGGRIETYYDWSYVGGYGILGEHAGSGDLAINMTGGTILNYTNAGGISAQRTGVGALVVSVSDGTVHSAADGISLAGASAKTVTLSNSTVQTLRPSSSSAIVFGTEDTDDKLTIAGPDTTTLQGDVTMRAGSDTVIFDTCLQADVADTGDTDCTKVTGDLEFTHNLGGFNDVETITKIGSGLARLNGLNASGAAMALKDGRLHLAGHLDLGAGELTIHNATRLIFGAAAPGDHATITASKVKFANDNWQKLYLAGSMTLDAGSDLLLDPNGNTTAKFYKSDGTTETDALKLYDLAEGELSDVSSDGLVSAAVSTDDLECGPIPTSAPFTITCDEDSYTPSVRGDDPGIEYDFGNSANSYTINIEDDPADPDTLAVGTTADNDSGLHARQGGGGNLAIAMAGGGITTAGSRAYGIHGDRHDSGDLTIGMSGGSIMTAGSFALGIYGERYGSGALTIGMSGGSIETAGRNAAGLSGYAGSTTQDDGTTAAATGKIAIAMSGGRIVTAGNSARGIYGDHRGNADLAIELTSALPGGVCDDTDTTGCDILAESPYAGGIYAYHDGTGAIAITMAGGDIRSGSTGIDSYHTGTGNIDITLSGGSITSISGHGIWADRGSAGVGDVDIEMSGGSIRTTGGHGFGILGTQRTTGTLAIAMEGGSITTEGWEGHGIKADHYSTAVDEKSPVAFTVDISDSRIVTSGDGANPVHLVSAAASRTLTLRNATLTAPSGGTAILFAGDKDDSLGIWGPNYAGMTATTSLRGDVAFGGGDDRLVFDSGPGDLVLDHVGAFTGLEKISKIGSGTLRLADIRAENATMSLEAGDLRLRGHLDLGSGGDLTVYHASRLIFGKTAEGHGRITASSVRINGIAQRLYAEATDTLSAGNDVLLGSLETRLRRSSSTSRRTRRNPPSPATGACWRLTAPAARVRVPETARTPLSGRSILGRY